MRGSCMFDFVNSRGNHMIKYYGVAYLTDGKINLSEPYDTQEECLNLLRQIINGPHSDRVERTTVIKRDLDQCKDPKFIFGCPKSLNVKK